MPYALFSIPIILILFFILFSIIKYLIRYYAKYRNNKIKEINSQDEIDRMKIKDL